MKEDDPKTGKVILFPMELIGTFKWNKNFGGRLKALRGDLSLHPELGKVSRPALGDMLAKKGIRFDKESIKKLEEGEIRSVTPELLEAMLSSLNSSIDAFYQARIKYDVPKEVIELLD
jgi:transcriptional regulator with XRE-family HTH domain